MEQNKSEDYIKGFIDALEFVVKSFRAIQINGQENSLIDTNHLAIDKENICAENMDMKVANLSSSDIKIHNKIEEYYNGNPESNSRA